MQIHSIIQRFTHLCTTAGFPSTLLMHFLKYCIRKGWWKCQIVCVCVYIYICKKSFNARLRWFLTYAIELELFRKWKHICRVSCDMTNTEFKWRLFTLIMAVSTLCMLTCLVATRTNMRGPMRSIYSLISFMKRVQLVILLTSLSVPNLPRCMLCGRLLAFFQFSSIQFKVFMVMCTVKKHGSLSKLKGLLYIEIETRSWLYHALVVCSHFFGVVSMKHASSFILFIAGMTEATALTSISWAGPKRWPVPLEHNNTGQTTLKNKRPHAASRHYIVKTSSDLHVRNSPHLQPVTRWSASPLIGHEIRLCLSPSQIFLCLYSEEATSLNHWPHLRLHLRY